MNATVDVVCYRSKVLANNESPLMLRVTKDRKRKYSSIGISINPVYWDFEKNQPKSTCPDRELLEKLISSKISEVKSKIVELKSEDKEFSATTLVDKVSNPVRFVTVGELFKQYLSRLEEESRIKKEYDEKLKYIEEKAGLEQELVKYIKERDTNGNEFLSLSEDIRTQKAEIAGKTSSAEQLKKALEAASKDEEMFASVKSIKSNLSQVLVDTASKKKLKDKIAQNLKSVSMAKKQVEEKNSGIDSMTDGRDKIKAEIAGLDKIIKEKDKNRILEENIEAEKKKNAIREAGSAVRDYLEKVSGLEAEKKELDRLGKTMEKSQADWEEKKKISDAAARKYEDAERLFNRRLHQRTGRGGGFLFQRKGNAGETGGGNTVTVRHNFTGGGGPQPYCTEL